MEGLVMDQIGYRIKQLLEAKEMTQKELAEKAGLHPSHLNRILNMRSGSSCLTIEKLASVLNVSPAAFFDDKILAANIWSIFLTIEQIEFICNPDSREWLDLIMLMIDSELSLEQIEETVMLYSRLKEKGIIKFCC